MRAKLARHRWSETRGGSRWVVLAVLVIVGYALGLLLVGSRFMSADAAKYVAIGRNVLAGRGPLNVFDMFFEAHSPAWPVIVMAPDLTLGVDWTLWSRQLQVAGAVGVLVLTGLLASPAGARAALLAVALLAAFPYGFELARDLGLDEVATMSTLLFVLVAIHGGRRPAATRWGVISGVTFGVAFLIKEIDIPFAPLPVLVALLAGRGWRVALRLLGTYAAVAFVVTSWWLVMFATQTGTVFRLGTPAWALVPIAIAVVAIAAIGWIVGRDEPATPTTTETAAGRIVRRERLVAWVAALGWTALVLASFQRAQAAAGNSLFIPAQYAEYMATWTTRLLPLTIFAGAGALIAFGHRVMGHPAVHVGRRIEALTMALVVGLPLVLVVIAVGEPPRHYMVVIAVLVALGAIGWLVALDAVQRALARRGGVLGRWAGSIVAMAIATAVLVSGLSIVRTTARDLRTVDASEVARATAVAQVGDWMAAELRPGDTVALGSTLRYEIGTRIPADVRARVVRQYVEVVHRPGFPLGIGLPAGAPADDWVVLSRDPNDVDAFNGYRRDTTTRQLRDDSIDIWIDGGIAPVGVDLPIDAALTHAAGLTLEASWVWPYRDGRELRLAAYRVGPSGLEWTSASLYLDGATLQRLVERFESSPVDDARAAQGVLDRAVLVDGPRLDLVERLRKIAGIPG